MMSTLMLVAGSTFAQDPIDATCAQIIAGTDGTVYRVTGTCTEIQNTTYGNWILKDETGEILIYGTLDAEGKTKNFASLGIEVGDKVTVHGPKKTYVNQTAGTTTIELVNVTVDNIEKGTAPTIQKITVVKALEIISGLAADAITTETYEIEAYVTSFKEAFNPEFGNYTLYIGDETTAAAEATLLVYRAKNADNQKFTEDVIKVGDKIIVKAKLQNYKGNTPETKDAVILSVNGQPTAIQTVKANAAQYEGKMYNLAGQVVNKGYKGIVIVNGRKMLNK